MKRLDLRDERGMTLVELLVATTAGVVVMAGISLSLIVTMRQTDRVTSHVEANQKARLTMTKVIDQLHSSCVAPQIVPVQEGSNGTSLTFLHQTGSAISPTPVKSTISLSGTTLSQSDYPATGGAAPDWIFATTPSSTMQLMTGVSAISASVPIFRYFSYIEGKINATPLSVPLSKARAEETVQVNVAFKAASMNAPPSGDTNGSTEIQNSALLRLTPPAYSSATSNRPCL
jgi:pilin/secretion family protein with methylation motif